MKLELFLTLYTKINSKWIKDLNERPETMKFGFKSIRQWTGYTAEKIFSNKEYDQGFKNYSVFLSFSSNCNTNMWFIIYIKVNHYWNASFKSSCSLEPIRVHSQWFLEGPHTNWNDSTIVQNFLSPVLVFGAVLSSRGSSFRKQKREKSSHATCLVPAPPHAWHCWLWTHLRAVLYIHKRAAGICPLAPLWISPLLASWWHCRHAALWVLLQGFYAENFLLPPLTFLRLQTFLCACVCSKNKVGYRTCSHRTCLSHLTQTAQGNPGPSTVISQG